VSEKQKLAGRIALVTGASRGIGRAVALALSRAGAHVIVTASTPCALEELDDEIHASGGTATIIPQNLQELDAIDTLGPAIFERWQKLDILVANAGVLGILTPLGHISAEEWRKVMDINLEANWRLIRTLNPVLQKSDAGRAVFVTSSVARSCNAYWGTYAVSKAALEALVKIYANEVATTKVRANLLDPGAVATKMRAEAFPGEDPAILPAPEALTGLFMEMCEAKFTKNGEVIAFSR